MPALTEKVRERPILMKDGMVCATLADLKTQTRRVVTPQPTGEPRPLIEWSRGLAAACHDPSPDPGKLAAHAERLRGRVFPFTTEHGSLMSPVCRYGKTGDRLWVREAWRVTGDLADTPIREMSEAYRNCLQFRADRDESYIDKYHPSIHMPRWASRIDLDITDIRLERLQDISEADAIAEGLKVQIGDGPGRPGPGYKWDGPGYHDGISSAKDGSRTYHVARQRFCCCNEGRRLKLTPARCAYRILWNSINAKRGYDWDSNPWVWVIVFKRLKEAA